MSRGHLSCPRLAGCTPGVSPAPAHSHRPERRLPFSGLRAAGGRGWAEPNSIFSVLSCTNGIQLGKKKPQPSQSALKKLRARDIFPHPQRINALRGSCAASATSAEGPAGTEGQGDPVATNGAGSSPRPGSGPAVCGVRATTVPARRGGRQTRPTRPPPVPDPGGDAPVTGPERAQLPPAARRLRALPQRRGHCPRPPGPGPSVTRSPQVVPRAQAKQTPQGQEVATPVLCLAGRGPFPEGATRRAGPGPSWWPSASSPTCLPPV